MDNVPQLLAAGGFFGAIFVCPMIYLFLKHQRAMAELIHRGGDPATRDQIIALRQEIQELKAARYAEIIQRDDRTSVEIRSE